LEIVRWFTCWASIYCRTRTFLTGYMTWLTWVAAIISVVV
jgi:hypothetical protein